MLRPEDTLLIRGLCCFLSASENLRPTLRAFLVAALFRLLWHAEEECYCHLWWRDNWFIVSLLARPNAMAPEAEYHCFKGTQPMLSRRFGIQFGIIILSLVFR